MFKKALKGPNVSQLKEFLHGLLEKETSKEVLGLDKEFQEIVNTTDKFGFMEKFEVKQPEKNSNLSEEFVNVKPEKEPTLLEAWTKYCLIRTQLSYLANQRDTLNQIKRQKDIGLQSLKKYQQRLQEEQENKFKKKSAGNLSPDLFVEDNHSKTIGFENSLTLEFVDNHPFFVKSFLNNENSEYFNLESIDKNSQIDQSKKQSIQSIQDKKNDEEFEFDPTPYNDLLKELKFYQEKNELLKEYVEDKKEKPMEVFINVENISNKNDEFFIQEKNIQQPLYTFEEFRKRMLVSSKPEFPVIPIVSSIESIVKDAVEHGVPLEKFIITLGSLYIQTVNTEHPTDPLTDEFRKIFMLIGAEMEKLEPSEELLQKYIKELQKADSIPPKKRNVDEEGSKAFEYLGRLYDSIPVFIKEIRRVCQDYYGSEKFTQHEEFFWQQVSTMFGDASWARFDADGNDEVDFKATSKAIREHHERVVEKHTAALMKIGIYCKEIERPLRDTIYDTNKLFYKNIKKHCTEKQEDKFLDFYNDAAKLIDKRDFNALIKLYEQQIVYIEKIYKDNAPEYLATPKQLLEDAKKVQRIAEFAGKYKIESVKEPVDGSIHHFVKLMEKHRDIIRSDTDNIQLKQKENETGKLASEVVIDEYNQLMKKHEQLFEQDPELKLKMRCFGVQLKSFGMTYGKGHARQNSAVYIEVWNTIIEDLKTNEKAKNISCIYELGTGTYKALAPDERVKFHKQLRKSPELLEIILRNFNNQYYSKKALQDIENKENEGLSNKKYALLQKELSRIEVISRHPMVENLIIANTENAANIFEGESLFSLFKENVNKKIVVIPLLETKQDLINYESILLVVIKARIQVRLEELNESVFNECTIPDKNQLTQAISDFDRNGLRGFLEKNKQLHRYLESVVFEIMLGYSDSERISGLGALITIQKTREDFLALCSDFGIRGTIYDGPGGDGNRGSLKKRKKKSTLQDKARRDLLTTDQSTERFRETQFFAAYNDIAHPETDQEFSKLPKYILEDVDFFEKQSTEFYEHLHDTTKGFGKLQGKILAHVQWFVALLNSSSRATQRGVLENQGDRTSCVQSGGLEPEKYVNPEKPRAISLTQMKEILSDFSNIFIGPGYGLRALGIDKCMRLYDRSKTFRDIYEKTSLGIALADLSITAYALFGSKVAEELFDPEKRKERVEKCKDYPELLENIEPEKFENNDEMLRNFFALIIDEYEATRDFIFNMNKRLHCWEYRQKEAPKKLEKSTDILFHNPKLQKEVCDIREEALPVRLAIARITSLVASNQKLDKVYPGLKEEEIKDSRLTGPGRLLGNLGSASRDSCTVPINFYEDNNLDLSQDFRPGVKRGEMDCVRLFYQKNKQKYQFESEDVAIKDLELQQEALKGFRHGL